MQTKFNFYGDSGHGWARVPRKMIIDLGLKDKISKHSYQRGEWVYLEEDRDLTLFVQAVEKADPKAKVRFAESHVNGNSKIRNYPAYNPETPWSQL